MKICGQHVNESAPRIALAALSFALLSLQFALGDRLRMRGNARVAWLLRTEGDGCKILCRRRSNWIECPVKIASLTTNASDAAQQFSDAKVDVFGSAAQERCFGCGNLMGNLLEFHVGGPLLFGGVGYFVSLEVTSNRAFFGYMSQI